eukprot:403363620
MRSTSQQPGGSRIPRFEDVLSERLVKQTELHRKFLDMPMIEDTSKTYKELCDGLIPQEDYFIDQLLDISAKFHGHYMTKMLKQVKAEKENLDKTKIEQTSQIKMLVEQVNLKHREFEKVSEDLDQSQKQNRILQALADKYKQELEDFKNQNFNIQFEMASNKSDHAAIIGDKLKDVYEKQLRVKIEELAEKDRQLMERQEEVVALQIELEFAKQNQKNHKEEKKHNVDHEGLDNTIKTQKTLIEELQRLIASKDVMISQYHMRDQTTENTLTFQIEQESKYKELVRQYSLLESDWKNMENYIRSLNEYQQHVETKYAQLLEEYQQILISKDEDSKNYLQSSLSKEQDQHFKESLLLKDEEISLLRDDQSKKEQKIQMLNQKILSLQRVSEENEQLLQNNQQIQQYKIQYQQELTQKDEIIVELEGKLKKLQQSNQNNKSEKDREINELQKNRDLNQKIILSLEKQLKDIELKQNKNQKTASDKEKLKKENDQLQKQIEQQMKLLELKEKEAEDFKNQKITDLKEMARMKNEVNTLKQDINIIQESAQVEQSNQNQDLEQEYNELEFYLNELKEVKERIFNSAVITKKAFNPFTMSGSSQHEYQMSPRDSEDFFINLRESQSTKSVKYVFQSIKEVIRKELEHLIVINQQVIDIQNFVQDKPNLLQTQSIQGISQTSVERAVMKLKTLFDNVSHQGSTADLRLDSNGNMISNNQVSNDFDRMDDIEEIADHVVATYELMQEENRLLLKEREYYYEQNLKKLVKENEDLRLETLKLKDQVMSLKSIESLKLQDLEKHLYDKQNQDFLSLAEQNDQLFQKNNQLLLDQNQLLQQIELYAQLNQRLQEENQYMKRKSNIKKGSGIVEDEPIQLNSKRENLRQKVASPDRIQSQERSATRQLGRPFSKRSYVPHNCSRNNLDELSNNRKSARCGTNTTHSPAPRILSTRPVTSTFNSDLKSPLMNQNQHKQPQNYSSTASHKGMNNNKQNSSQNLQLGSSNPIYSSNRVSYRNPDEENDKLNTLIEDYRRENDRCTQKIQELQEKLHTTSRKLIKDKVKDDGQSDGGLHHNWNQTNNSFKGLSNNDSIGNYSQNNILLSDINPQRLGTGPISHSTKSLQHLALNNQQSHSSYILHQNLPEKDTTSNHNNYPELSPNTNSSIISNHQQMNHSMAQRQSQQTTPQQYQQTIANIKHQQQTQSTSHITNTYTNSFIQHQLESQTMSSDMYKKQQKAQGSLLEGQRQGNTKQPQKVFNANTRSTGRLLK